MHIGNQPPCLDCSSPIHLRSFKWCHYTDPPGYTIMRVEAHVAVHCQLCLCHDRQLTTIDLEVVECFDVFWPLCLWRPGLISQINPIKKNNLLTIISMVRQWFSLPTRMELFFADFHQLMYMPRKRLHQSHARWIHAPPNRKNRNPQNGRWPEHTKDSRSKNSFLKPSLGFYVCGQHTLPSRHVRAHVAKHVTDHGRNTQKHYHTLYIHTIISIYIVSTCA